MYPFSPAQVSTFHEQMLQHLPATPLYRSHTLSELYSTSILVKQEMMSPISSFKGRGALAAMLELPDHPIIVTASTGNFGQGVAFAGKILEREVHVFVPHGPNPDKVRSMQLLGATIHEVGRDLDEAKARERRGQQHMATIFWKMGRSRRSWWELLQLPWRSWSSTRLLMPLSFLWVMVP